MLINLIYQDWIDVKIRTQNTSAVKKTLRFLTKPQGRLAAVHFARNKKRV